MRSAHSNCLRPPQTQVTTGVILLSHGWPERVCAMASNRRRVFRYGPPPSHGRGARRAEGVFSRFRKFRRLLLATCQVSGGRASPGLGKDRACASALRHQVGAQLGRPWPFLTESRHRAKRAPAGSPHLMAVGFRGWERGRSCDYAAMATAGGPRGRGR